MSNFANTMNEMRGHYLNNLNNLDNLNNGILLPYYPNLLQDSLGLREEISTDPDGIAKIEGLKSQAQEISITTASYIETELHNSSNQLKASGDSTTFKEKLDKIREEAKKKAAENIDKMFDNAQKVGDDHPSIQNMILLVTQKISDFISDFLSKIINYIGGIIQNISKWIQNAFKSIASKFNDIKNWVLHWF